MAEKVCNLTKNGGSNFLFLESSDFTNTIAGNSQMSRALSDYVTVPTGYTVVAITPIATGSDVTQSCVIKVIGVGGDNTNLAIAIRNIGATQVTWKSRVKVVCYKQ